MNADLQQHYTDTFNRIAADLRQAGAEVKIDVGFDKKVEFCQSINGENVVFKVNHERGRHHFHNGKLRVAVHANYEVVKQFPQKKDGSFNYEKIVETILDHCKKVKEKRESIQQVAQKVAENKEEAKGFGTFGVNVGHESSIADSVVVGAGGFKILLLTRYENLDHEWSIMAPYPKSRRTAEEVRKILEVLHREGLLKKGD